MRIDLKEARRIAAEHLAEAGRSGDAHAVLGGGGDDFAEVLVALRAIGVPTAHAERLGRALAVYADAEFWEGSCAEASLAFHDGGAIARAAIAGRDLHEFHRD